MDMEPKIGMYVQFRRRIISQNFVTKVHKLKKRLLGEDASWWTTQNGLIVDHRGKGEIKLIGKIEEDYLVSHYKPARLNSIFRHKIEIEYS